MAFDDIFFIEHKESLTADFSTVKLHQFPNDGTVRVQPALINKKINKITFPFDGSRNHTLPILIILLYILFYDDCFNIYANSNKQDVRTEYTSVQQFSLEGSRYGTNYQGTYKARTARYALIYGSGPPV